MSDSDDHQILDQALDLFVYAPLGLALEAREQWPRYIERGKGQIAMARVMGRFAAAKGQNEATKIVAAAIDGFTTGSAGNTRPADANAQTDTAPADTVEVEAAFPIDDYDTLTAATIVSLLSGLDTAAIDRVRDHESDNRKRVTVLNRAAQLLGET